MKSWLAERPLALLVLLFVVGLSVCAPLLATHDPRAVNLDHSRATPSAEHPLGTDLFGRDVYSRALYGGRGTLGIAAGATLIAALGGGILGSLASGNRWSRGVFTLLLDALLSLPGLLVALVLLTALGSSPYSVMLALGIAGIAPFGRTVRDTLRAGDAAPYLESAVSLGAGRLYILWHYRLRNAAPALLTFTGISFSWSVLNGAALTFLGLAGELGAPDWGAMLSEGRAIFASAPWEALSAGVLLSLTVWSVNRLFRG